MSISMHVHEIVREIVSSFHRILEPFPNPPELKESGNGTSNLISLKSSVEFAKSQTPSNIISAEVQQILPPTSCSAFRNNLWSFPSVAFKSVEMSWGSIYDDNLMISPGIISWKPFSWSPSSQVLQNLLRSRWTSRKGLGYCEAKWAMTLMISNSLSLRPRLVIFRTRWKGASAFARDLQLVETAEARAREGVGRKEKTEESISEGSSWVTHD